MTDPKMQKDDNILPAKAKATTGKCLACGASNIKPGRRYCCKECRRHMLWVLSLSKGLLRVFNARYAAFSFDESHVILDVLPVWSKDISRFKRRRTSGEKPAEGLKRLLLQSGKDWYHMINNKNSKSYASLCLLQKNHNKCIAPDSIKPNKRLRPRFSKLEKESLKILQLELKELLSDGHQSRIKSAYKKLAKLYHPDVGGDAEKFKKLNEAQHQISSWAENPQFTSRKALIDCWSYDGATNRWSPPL